MSNALADLFAELGEPLPEPSPVMPRIVCHRSRRRRKNVPAATRYQFVTTADVVAGSFARAMRAFGSLRPTWGDAFVYIIVSSATPGAGGG